MYKRSKGGLLKHIDFIILDVLALLLSFFIASMIRLGYNPFTSGQYRILGLILVLMDLLSAAFFNTMHNVLKRGYFAECIFTLQHALIVFAGGIIFLFAVQSGEAYSRVTLFLTLGFHIILSYVTRIAWKKWLMHRGKNYGSRDMMLVVTDAAHADSVLERLQSATLEEYSIVGLVLDRQEKGKVHGVPVVAAIDEAPAYICREWIDRVYIDCSLDVPGISQLMDACWEMAVPVHLNIATLGIQGDKQFVEKVGGTMVLTTTKHTVSPGGMIVKRTIDILGGVLGSLVALIIMAVVGPMIKKASPGPILYRQERIGQNGKRIKIIKLRSMYMDADERKKELMAQNRVKDGMMFKMDFDPRIIGNVTLPDGTRKTGIGEFIRRTSLDGSVIIRQTRKKPLLARVSPVLSKLNLPSLMVFHPCWGTTITT